MNDIKIRFGNKLKKLRKEKTDLSQESFAAQIDLDRTYYSSIENGKRNVSLVNLEKISAGLGITLSELFSDIEKE
ncbi:helix-turn-helix domain-containing protein [Mycoplasmopsis fermentans]|uniref:Control protein C.MunI n=1 Tax=Mycoplasma sp. TaxID=2108 RepID=MUNC_MYCSP|nr:helix-turn-helix transcriptional regulator [Mycoplasmopsis fermentans]P43640.1 RecName: Full=Control protein C.MunI; AltName: Full=Regulatory protein MunI [Mycoplasma sp.]RMX36078.1 C.AhdI [Mycoplasmopsis fermentans MF-I2]RMX36148.1 C.AhdI [Mycoplasmopsis fermentans MF-I1]CAA53787.1 MunI regulatory protein [Mycoplasma sp.]